MLSYAKSNFQRSVCPPITVVLICYLTSSSLGYQDTCRASADPPGCLPPATVTSSWGPACSPAQLPTPSAASNGHTIPGLEAKAVQGLSCLWAWCPHLRPRDTTGTWKREGRSLTLTAPLDEPVLPAQGDSSLHPPTPCQDAVHMRFWPGPSTPRRS